MKFGVHVSKAGGFGKALNNAIKLKCDTIQMFSGNPRSLRYSKINEEEALHFRQGLKEKKINPLVIHAPYLLNLASPKDNTYLSSINALAEEIMRCKILGGNYLVFHPGNHLGAGIEKGIKRIASAITKASEISKLDENNGLILLLEMMSGAGTEVGWAFEHQKAIIDMAQGIPLGVCLDTCHMFAAGYDIATEKGLSITIEQIEKIVGFSSIKIIHANDSVGELGSRKDRHAAIGEGMIGKRGFHVILSNPQLRELPFILETPKTTIEDDKKNLAIIKRLAEEAVI